MSEEARHRGNFSSAHSERAGVEYEDNSPWAEYPEFTDLAGMDDVVSRLKQVSLLHDNLDLCDEWDVAAPHGILLQGPGGVGKTQLVRALARHTRSELFEIKVTDILDMYVGNSNRNLAMAFEAARCAEDRALLFFDEFDGLFGPDASGNPGVANGLLVTMKTEMNNVPPHVTVIGATNRIVGFDEALLRPGRFDVIIQVPMPNSASRARIFGAHIGRLVDKNKYDLGALDLDMLAEQTEGLSGADIESILKAARTTRLVAHLEEGQLLRPVTQRDILTSIGNHRRQRPHATD